MKIFDNGQKVWFLIGKNSTENWFKATYKGITYKQQHVVYDENGEYCVIESDNDIMTENPIKSKKEMFYDKIAKDCIEMNKNTIKMQSKEILALKLEIVVVTESRDNARNKLEEIKELIG